MAETFENTGENHEQSDVGEISAVENNRRILATYSREKLIQFINDTTGGDVIGGKKVEEIEDDEKLRSFALAITQGI